MEEMLIKLDVARMEDDGQLLTGEVDGGRMDLEMPMSTGAGVVKYELRAFKAGKRVIVSGKISCKMRAICSRCALDFSLVVDDEEFEREYEVAADQIFVDLTSDVRESILLSFPACPVCASDCRGVCPGCRQDLNRQECKCKEPPQDLRWGPLDGLRMK